MLGVEPGLQSPGAATVVKLNTSEYVPGPHVLVACTRQKKVLLVFRVTFEVQLVPVKPLAEATTLLKPASVATWML